MNILVTGGATSGSWQIRGLQLGKAIGAEVIPRALDVAAFDLAVVVKRPPRDTVLRIHKAGIPLVWDPLDAWPQPDGNDWAKHEAMAWLHMMVKFMRPAAIVAATKAMALDCAVFGVPVLTVPHHSRPGLKRTPLRTMRVVGYEGGPQHLGSWVTWFELECARRGWTFHMKPESINDLDIVIAMRERHGYAPRTWKSNVKLANAQASGTPIICGREAGYLEQASGGERFADTPEEVVAALDALEPIHARQEAAETLATRTLTLETVAKPYRAWLETVCATVPSC